MTAHIVNYPAPLLAPYPPATLVVVAPFDTLDWPTYAGQVIEGLQRLAAMGGRDTR